MVNAVAHHDFLFLPAPVAVPGFQIDPFAKLFGVLDGTGVSGGTWIAKGESLLIPLWSE